MNLNTFEPPAGDDLKCEELEVAYWKLSYIHYD